MLGAAVNVARFLATHPLTRDHKLRAFGRFLSWQLRSSFGGELVVPWIEGTRLCVRRGMTGATGNVYAGLHEFADMAFLLHFLRRDDLFVDVGANVGSYTVLASGVCRARSIAFEPDPGTFQALERNIALNDLTGRVTARQLALGREPGLASFTVGLDTTNHVLTESTEPAQTVVMSSLDYALDGAGPVMIKLDVEGFEPEVLRGSVVTLHCSTLQSVLTENRSPEVLDALRNAGFEERSYDPFARRLLPPEKAAAANALFVRDRAFVQNRLLQAPSIRVLETRL